MAVTKLWVEKYKPSSIDQYIFHSEDHKKQFLKMIKNRDIPNLLLSGAPGSGKSTLSNILVTALNIDDCDLLRINASDENSIDVMREKISSFVSTYAIGGHFKIVQLEEADYLTLNAFAMLRGMMEDNSNNARFILTCNYENKIIPPVKSRLQHFHFKSPSLEETTIRCAEILATECVDFDLDVLDKYIASAYPDIRKIINLLQQHSLDNKLITPTTADSSDYNFKIIELLEKGDLRELRKVVCENVSREEYEGLYRFLYENIKRVPKFSDVDAFEGAIVQIASYLYKHGICADPEINFAALCIELGQL
jgi:DNA polymerase III delta prime subunit